MDLIPKEDKAEFEIKLRANAGISLDEMIKESKEVEKMVQADKNVIFTTLSVGYNSVKEKNKALIYVKLTPKDKRKIHQEEIIQSFREKLKKFSDKFFITAAAIPNIKGAGVTVPYQIVLTSDSFDDLDIARKNLMAYLAKKKGFVDIDSNLDEGKPQIDIKIIRENANKMGISASQIAQAISIAFSSDLEISYFEQNGKQYKITLRLLDKNRISINDLKKIQLRAKNGELVFLDGLVEFKNSKSLSSIYHYNRQ